MSVLDTTMPDAAIVERLDAMLLEARNLADLVATRGHLGNAGVWLQQIILGATQAHEAAELNAEEAVEETIHRARMLSHYIWTHTGVEFYPQDPQASEVKLEDIAFALAHKNRWSGHAKPVVSVDEHSLVVAALARAIAEHEGADPDEAALYGLLHDAHEAYLPDVARRVQMYMGSELPKMCEAVQAVILEALEVPPPSPVIDGIVQAADDYALRFEAEDCFPESCDPEVSRVGRDPPAWLRDVVLPSAPLWEDAVVSTLEKLRATKPFLDAVDSWKDQGDTVEDTTQVRCMVCERANPPVSRLAVSGGLCAECLEG